MFKFFNVCWIFRKMIRLNLMLIKCIQDKQKNSKCDVHTLPKKLIAKRLYL